jgi:hypothetical protein
MYVISGSCDTTMYRSIKMDTSRLETSLSSLQKKSTIQYNIGETNERLITSTELMTRISQFSLIVLLHIY